MLRHRLSLGVVSVLSIFLFAILPINARAGTERVVHEFNEFPEWNRSQAGLVADSAGNLYGTGMEGGAFGGSSGYGTVFELIADSDGKYRHTVLHDFTGGNDGRTPLAGVTLDAAGNVWGTTAYGGPTDAAPCSG